MEVVNNNSYILSFENLKENTFYQCVKKWDITKNGALVKSYDTKEEAEEAFNKIVSELTKDKIVIKLD